MNLSNRLEDLITMINARGFSLPGTDTRLVSISNSYYPPSFTDHEVFSGMGYTALEATRNAIDKIITQEKW